MRAPDYTVAYSRPECLNRLTSPPADSLFSWLAGPLKARQTASPVTARARSNDYLSAIGPAPYGVYENCALRKGAVMESAI
jgi:hypothetical protein